MSALLLPYEENDVTATNISQSLPDTMAYIRYEEIMSLSPYVLELFTLKSHYFQARCINTHLL